VCGSEKVGYNCRDVSKKWGRIEMWSAGRVIGLGRGHHLVWQECEMFIRMWFTSVRGSTGSGIGVSVCQKKVGQDCEGVIRKSGRCLR